jgi:hypothetical protein
MNTRSRKLLDQVRDAIRVKHYSYRTEEGYVNWIRRFILFHDKLFHDKRHPKEMGVSEIESFLKVLHLISPYLCIRSRGDRYAQTGVMW